jgi:hypothetical protein
LITTEMTTPTAQNDRNNSGTSSNETKWIFILPNLLCLYYSVLLSFPFHSSLCIKFLQIFTIYSSIYLNPTISVVDIVPLSWLIILTHKRPATIIIVADYGLVYFLSTIIPSLFCRNPFLATVIWSLQLHTIQ